MTTMPEGTVLAGYRVTGLIAEGGMGSVHMAESLATGERVALKVLLAEHAGDDAFRRRFLREARYAAEVDHPGVVRVVEAGMAGESLYIAMEFVEGEELTAVLAREGPLEPERAVEILGQVAAALDAAHAAGIVHRDVKPGNVIVSVDGRARLADFGLSKSPSQDSMSLTGPGEYVGTFFYTAPEQILGTTLDGRADVYSLACVLCECLTGEPPFVAERSTEVLGAHLDAPPPSLSDRRPGLPRGLDETVARALAKDAAARFATCGELIEAAAGAVRAAELAPVAGGSGQADLRLRVSAGNASGTAIEVHDELVIGREADGVGRLAEDAEISRRHARIASAGSGYTIEDLGSTNGTFVNGRRIDKPEHLGVGDEVQVGSTTLIVQVSAPTTAPEPAAVKQETAEVDVVEPEAAEPEGQPDVPRLAFRVELDYETGEARIELDEGSDSIRLVLEDGAWRIKPG